MAWPKNKGEQKQFSVRVIDELRNIPSEKGDGGTTLRMEAWSVDGREGQPALAKRDYWANESGNQSGKAKGFNRSDWEFILKNLSRISKHFQIPPQLVQEAIRESMEDSPTAQPQQELVGTATNQEAADPWK